MRIDPDKIELPQLEHMACAVYGLGLTGKEIIQGLLAHKAKIAFIIDKQKAGTSYLDIPVIHPDALHSMQLNPLQCLIALNNHYVNLAELYAGLSRLPFKKVWLLQSYLPLFQSMPLSNPYWLDNLSVYHQQQTQITHLRQLFADDKSAELFEQIIQYRVSGDIQYYPTPSFSDEYAPHDLPSYVGPLHVIDCGAFTGVALQKLKQAGYAIESFIAFEPDLSNYEKLVNTNVGARSATYLPLGVWSSNVQLRFNHEASMGSKLSALGDAVVQCVRGDDVSHGFAPNLIKFDVEGAEIEALRGFQHTIQTYQPNLAVSVYHLADHLFSILQMIDHWQLNYTFYLRVHEHNSFGVVLYCINPSLVE